MNSIPAEVLIKILSHLSDASSKIRLERVSRKLRDCIRNEEAWERDTTLEMSQFGSDLKLRSFLKHTKEIKFLLLHDCGKLRPEIVATLWEFEHKLKLERFQLSLSKLCVSNCPGNSNLAASCLDKFSKSLKSVHVSCCRHKYCQLVAVLIPRLPRCTNLTSLTLRHFDDHILVENQDREQKIIRELLNMNLQTLHLADFSWEINVRNVVAVFNSAKQHSVRSLHVQNTRGDVTSFAFDEFCELLEPPAAEAIKSIQLLKVYETNWADCFNTLPTKMPNLSRLTIAQEVECPEPYRSCKCRKAALKDAKAIRDFLHDFPTGRNAVDVELTLSGCQKYRKSLWSMVINLVQVKQSGTNKRKREKGWKRTLTNHCATIQLDIRPWK